MSGQPADRSPRRDDPYATFRPRWGKRVPRTFAVIVLVATAFAAATIPGVEWTILDRLFFFLLGAATAGLLWRYSIIEARPTREGLRVRNLFSTRQLSWAEIMRVQFGGGAPWASLDLSDTDTVPVMAIQKADGAHARAMAARLAALVEYHGDAPEGQR